LTFASKFSIAASFLRLGRLLHQNLHGLGQDQLAVHALRAQEAHLPIGRVQLAEALEGTPLTIGYPVVAKIAEQDGLCRRRDGGHVGGSVHRPVENGIRGTCGQRRLPEVLTRGILELANRLDGRVVQDPHRILAVGAEERVVKVDQLIRGNGSGSRGRYARACTAGSRQNTEGLSGSEDLEQALDEIVWLICLLCNQGVQIHNFNNPNDKQELLSEETVELLTTPSDLAVYKDAIMAAMFKGTKREVESEDASSKNG